MSSSPSPKTVHPDIELLRACARGALPVSTQALIRFHVNSCKDCGANIEQIELAEGGRMLDIQPLELKGGSRDDILRRVRAIGAVATADDLLAELQPGHPLPEEVPPVVQRLVQSLTPALLRSLVWRDIASGVRFSGLSLGRERLTVVSLDRERASMPEAQARVTHHALVLEGQLQVGGGTYQAGDFFTWLAGESWSPTNMSRSKCVYVAEDIGAFKFKKWYTEVLMRFYRLAAR